MSNIFITGVAGFLGSHLANRYLSEGHRVYGVDNFSSSQMKSVHFTELCKHPRFVFAAWDICENLHNVFDERFDLLCNFACPASPPRYQAIPIETMMTCVVGTKNVLDLAKKHKAIVVHASTSEIYGDPDRSPQQEIYRGNVNCYGPRACYDEGKRAASALCFDYLNKYNVDVRVVRIFNTYGPHMDPCDGRVVSNFICQAIKREPLTIYGHGQQTRSFCYVDDLVDGIVAMSNLLYNPLQPINLGNPNEFTITELAYAVIRETLSLGLNYKRLPMPVDDPIQRCPDITRAQDLLGWSPKIQLTEGLVKTIEYFKQVLPV